VGECRGEAPAAGFKGVWIHSRSSLVNGVGTCRWKSSRGGGATAAGGDIAMSVAQPLGFLKKKLSPMPQSQRRGVYIHKWGGLLKVPSRRVGAMLVLSIVGIARAQASMPVEIAIFLPLPKAELVPMQVITERGGVLGAR